MLDSTLKVSAIVLLALAANGLLRLRSAALRHWVLAAACSCALTVPVLQVLVPAWDVPFAFAPHVRTAGQVTTTVDAARVEERIAPASAPGMSWMSPRRTDSR